MLSFNKIQPSKPLLKKKDDFTKDFYLSALLFQDPQKKAHTLSESNHPTLFFSCCIQKTVPILFFSKCLLHSFIHSPPSILHPLKWERSSRILHPPFLHHEPAPNLSSPAARSPGSQPISRSSETSVTRKECPRDYLSFAKLTAKIWSSPSQNMNRLCLNICSTYQLQRWVRTMHQVLQIHSAKGQN